MPLYVPFYVKESHHHHHHLPTRFPCGELGKRIYSGYEVNPAVEQDDAAVSDVTHDGAHPLDKQHTASAEEYLVLYTHGYFTACAHTALAGLMKEVERDHPDLFSKISPILAAFSEIEENQRVRLSYLRLLKGQHSKPEDRAFAAILRENYFEIGAEHLGSQQVTALQENFRVSKFAALQAATAKRAAALQLQGPTANPRKQKGKKKTDEAAEKQKADKTKA